MMLTGYLVPFVFLFLSPIDCGNRSNVDCIELTEIGNFGLVRKARPTVPAHLHTGIDIKRPGKNYNNEPIFPVAPGKVISKRTDGPYAQLILEHHLNGNTFWTLYEHIAGIQVNVGDAVNPQKPIARFMNKAELNKHGWQFDHFHLEILKTAPLKIKPDKQHPDRHFLARTLQCFGQKDLETHYYSPLRFLRGI